MKNDALYDRFIETVRERIPENTKLVSELMDLLFIEKEAVYRRLRREVPFTFSEIATISNKLGISIDCVVGTAFHNTRPFQYTPIEYTDPEKIDLSHIEQFISVLNSVKEGDTSEFTDCSNVLPQTIYLAYEHLMKFYIFKWKYQRGGLEGNKKYGDLYIPQKVKQIAENLVVSSRNISKTFYVLDNLIFQYLVNNIKYFASIDLINPDEIELLKEDLNRLLDDLEVLTARGYHEETGNQVLIYISNINFETSYCYFETPSFHVCMVKAFALNSIHSMDEDTFQSLKNWMASLKRLSTMISVSGEMQRTIYFRKQREIIATL